MSTVQIVTGIGVLLLIGLVFVLLDRILARRERGETTFGGSDTTSIGNALMEVQSFVDPSARHRIEEEHRQHEDENGEADPPEAGQGRG